MANTLRFKRGLVSGIPTAALGEPLFTTDTFDLYIGNGTTNTRFQKYIASGTTGQLLRGDGSLLTMPIVLTSPSNGQVLKYNGTSWVNDSDAGITGSGANGQVAFFTGATTQSGSNNLFWDATNNRLGIGQNVPRTWLHIASTTGGRIYLEDTDATNTYNITDLGNNFGNFAIATRSFDGGFVRTDYQIARDSLTSQYHRWYNGSGNEILRLHNTGNLHLGGTSDNGLRFQVTGDGYFSGSVGIGSTSLTGVNLHIAKGLSSSSSVNSVLNNIAITNVTDNVSLFAGFAGTTAGNLTNLFYYRSGVFSLGAGTTVTNMYGFAVQSGFVGATNNYGFYGDVPSGTGRWNLYMNGTAANYLAGDLRIGTATSGERLRVVNNTNSTAIAMLRNDAADGYSTLNFYDNGNTVRGSVGYANPSASTHADSLLLWAFTGKDVRIVSGNTNISVFKANGNLLIGTTTDAGYKLDINGTMRVSGASTISLNQNATTQLDIQNTTVGTGSVSRVNLGSDASAGFGNMSKYSSSITAYKIFSGSDFALYNGTAGNISILNDFASGVIRFAAGGSSTAHFTIASTGAATFSSSVTCSSLVVDSTTLVVDATNNRVGVNTNVPTSSLHVVGSVTKSHTTKTANYTMTESDHTVLCNTSGGGFTISLPAASGCSGRIYVIKKITANSGLNNITIDPNGSETIDGATTHTLQCRSSVMIQSDGSNWWILAERADTSCL